MACKVRRQWLVTVRGDHTADSYWRTEVGPVGDPTDGYYYRHVRLKVADCDRNIKLEFGYCTERSRMAMLRKLDRLQAGLNVVREALEAGDPLRALLIDQEDGDE